MINFSLKKQSALLVDDRLTRKYLTGIDVAEGYLVITDEYAFFTDARYYSQAKTKMQTVGVKTYLFNGLSNIKDYLGSKKIKNLYIDYEHTSLAQASRLKDFKVKLKDCNSLLVEARSIKNQTELDNVKKACKIAQTAFYNCLPFIKSGITETYLKDKIEKEMVKLGAEGPAFDTIVAFGKNGAVPHHETGDTVLTENTAILVDTGCTVNGYCSDITRTVFYGQPSEKFVDCYNAVLQANLTAISNIENGTACNQADAIARKVLEEKGLAEYFTHSLGHGVGLEIHESPTLSKRSTAKLINGMVFTIEPGVYIDGELGIRIEDTVVLKDGKIERLYDDDKELIKIKI